MDRARGIAGRDDVRPQSCVGVPRRSLRPATAARPGSRGRTETAGELAMQHRIVSLRREAEELRNENLRIMAGAVQQHTQSVHFGDVAVDATMLAASFAPVNAGNGQLRSLRPPSGKSVRSVKTDSRQSPNSDSNSKEGNHNKENEPTTKSPQSDVGSEHDDAWSAPRPSAAYPAEELLALLPPSLQKPPPLRLPAAGSRQQEASCTDKAVDQRPALTQLLQPHMAVGIAADVPRRRRAKSAKVRRYGDRDAIKVEAAPALAPAIFEKIAGLMDAGRSDRQIMNDVAVHAAGVTPAQLHRVRRLRA